MSFSQAANAAVVASGSQHTVHNGAAHNKLKVLRVWEGQDGAVAVSHTWTEGGRKQWQAEWGAEEPGHMDCRSFRVVSTSSWSMWFFSRSTSSSSVCQQKLLLNNGSPDTFADTADARTVFHLGRGPSP